MNDFPQEATAQPDQALWNRPIVVDFKQFFLSLGKVTLATSLMQWNEMSAGALEAAAALGITRSPQQLAGALLQRAMTRATLDLLAPYRREFSDQVDEEVNQVGKQIGEEITNTPIPLNEDFFDRPREIQLLPLFEKKLATWLECRKMGDLRPETIAARLPAFFVYALHQELRENRIDYGPLGEFVRTEVSEAWRRERDWHGYTLGLTRELDEPLFEESFSLRQIFLWPNAYFEKKRPDEDDAGRSPRSLKVGDSTFSLQPKKRRVVELKEALDAWIEAHDRQDAIRVISGDPGSGKSSFVRMYAQHRIEHGDRVLVAPLYKLNVLDDLAQSLDAYCQERDDCPVGLLTADTAEPTLLLVLDGLDELSKQGVIGARIAASFVEEVIRKVRARNESSLRVRVLLSGRPVAVQNVADKFRAEGQLFHLLPYYAKDKGDDTYVDDLERLTYVDELGLLKVDLRQRWWRRYGELKGVEYEGLPEELSSGRLEEVTSQPLLNYLIALAYQSGAIDFTKDVCRNEIYDAILDRVHGRDWDPAREHRGQGNIQRDDFRDLLQEMALTAWHDRERTTSVNSLRTRCKGNHLQDVLDEYEKGCDEGIGQLFTAFYFRKSNQVDGPEATFEFTHKSFAEYLTACRIVHAAVEIHEALTAGDKTRSLAGRWTESDALRVWLDVCGPAEISGDLMEYIVNEVRVRVDRNKLDATACQTTLARLINATLADGMPCQDLSGGPSFREMTKLSRNADEALLVLHGALARTTGQVSQIKWPNQASAGTWIHCLRGQRSRPESRVSLLSLNNMDFGSQVLDFVDLYAANLNGVSLNGATLYGATLYGADLYRADLTGANLTGARLAWANLTGASLARANLYGADLTGAYLTEANLTEANLTEAKLLRADLSEANLTEANLTEAKLHRADLRGADLRGATLHRATLDEVNLDEAMNVPKLSSSRTDRGDDSLRISKP